MQIGKRILLFEAPNRTVGISNIGTGDFERILHLAELVRQHRLQCFRTFTCQAFVRPPRPLRRGGRCQRDAVDSEHGIGHHLLRQPLNGFQLHAVVGQILVQNGTPLLEDEEKPCVDLRITQNDPLHITRRRINKLSHRRDRISQCIAGR